MNNYYICRNVFLNRMLNFLKIIKSELRNFILLFAVILTAFYFFKVFSHKPVSENITLPEIKIVNTTIQLDNETNNKLKSLELLLETVKTKNDSAIKLKLKYTIKDLDSILFNKSKELNNISKNNVDSIVKILNNKIAKINEVQNTISNVKEDYEYRTDLYQSLILFIVAIIGFFGYSNFKDIEVKSKQIAEETAEKKAEERVNEFTDEKISDIVSIKAEEKVGQVIQDIADKRFNEITKNYEDKLDKVINEKWDSYMQTENDDITNLKAEIKDLKRRISEL